MQNLLFSGLLEGIFKGLTSSLIPGVHPMFFDYSSTVSASFAHGFFTSVSIVPSIFLAVFDVGVVYTAIVSLRFAAKGLGRYAVSLYLIGVVTGILLSAIYLPVSSLLQFRLPRSVVFSLLLFLAVVSLLSSEDPVRYALFALAASGFGLFALTYPLYVAHPLEISVAGLFGTSTLLLSLIYHRTISPGSSGRAGTDKIVFGSLIGFLAGVFVAYFPAVSVSVAAFLLHPVFGPKDEEILVSTGSAASTSLLFSGVGRNYGLVRSSLAAKLPEFVYIPRMFSAFAVGASLGVVFALLFLPLLARVYSSRIAKFLALVFIVLWAFSLSSVQGILLLASATSLGVLTHVFRVEKRVLMFFLLAPTLLYYAPM